MKRSQLSTAILAGLTGLAGMASVSHAVNVNPDGLGQVLLYPYYTARGGNDTLISIVNTSVDAKAVKIRFIEALNSREVLDFNIYMSPFDVWTAAITENEVGGGKMTTSDTTCTVPYFQGGTPGDVGEQSFLSFQYTGANPDGGPSGIERTASGYIEVIEMASIPAVQPTTAEQNTFNAIKHVNGVPRNGGNTYGAPCSRIVGAWAGGGFVDWNTTNDALQPPTGGLFGNASIISVNEGTMITYEATSIDGFWADNILDHTDPGSLFPSLGSGQANRSFAFFNGDLDVQDWAASIQAVNATLTLDSLMNEYNVESALAARSEWVLTFPTKRFHVDTAPGGAHLLGTGSNSQLPPIPPFSETWVRITGNASVDFVSSCEDMSFKVYDREEATPQQGIIVSPPPPEQGFFLCREANVIRFAGEEGLPAETEILKEIRRDPVPGNFFVGDLSYTNLQLPTGFESGWVEFDLATRGGDNSTRLSLPSTGPNAPTSYVGLPVIGFWANSFTNNAVEVAGQTVLANYGGSFNHRGTRSSCPSSIVGTGLDVVCQ